MGRARAMGSTGSSTSSRSACLLLQRVILAIRICCSASLRYDARHMYSNAPHSVFQVIKLMADMLPHA